MKIDTSFAAVPVEVCMDEYGDVYTKLCHDSDATGDVETTFVIERIFYFNGRPNYARAQKRGG